MTEVKLYPFQQYTVDRFREVRSVLIGDDMGLGKSAQAIALDVERRKNLGVSGKTLIVTPLAVVGSWMKQFKMWAPHLNVIPVNNRNRTPFLESVDVGDNDVYICHWQALRLMPELADRKWFHLIADEIHYIQNRKTKQSAFLKQISAEFKTGLSGTPAYDKPDDLWSVLNWLYPTFWTSYWAYFDRYVLWVDYNGYKQIIGVANQEELQEQMRGFYIRRQKSEVLQDLPDVYETPIYVDLAPKQRRAYNQMRDSMLAWVGENEDKPVNASVVIAQLTRLQQFASAHAEVFEVEKWEKCDDINRPWYTELLAKFLNNEPLTDKEAANFKLMSNKQLKRKVVSTEVRLADPSSKIDAAIEVIQSTGRQMVFFSQFAQVIDLFAERLKKHKISHAKYTGATNAKDRLEAVDQFSNGRIQIFAATLRAGGTGLDGLQVASDVGFFDRDWSHSTNSQAIGRLHRIGQKNAVQVIDFIASGTLERKRMEKITMEWSWIRELLGEDD